MLKTFPIDFVRELIVSKLAKNRNRAKYFDDEDIKLVSFFEHLASDDEVNRYVETFKELCAEQNREHYIGLGTISITDTPDITNIKDSFISPFSWGTTIRCTLENRDKMIATLYDLYGELKGRTFDIAQLDSGKLVVVGCVGSKLVLNSPAIMPNDFIGTIEIDLSHTFDYQVKQRIDELTGKGLSLLLANNDKFYVELDGKLVKVVLIQTLVEGEIVNEYKIDEELGYYERYCLDISLTDISCNSPRTINASEYCTISFGGQATLSSASVMIGNQMCLFGIKEYKLDDSNKTSFTSTILYLDPAENSGALSTNQITNQIRSSLFMSKTHTDSISPSLQYSFVVDRNKPLIMKLYRYAKYGERSDSVSGGKICPNTIFELHEIVSSWGNYENNVIYAKLADNIPVEVSEADIVSIQCTFTIQGLDLFLNAPEVR